MLRLVLPFLFLSCVTLNGALTLMGWQPSSKIDENRALATAPVWEGSLASYIQATDRWLTDSFAFRKPLASSYNALLYYGFHSTLNDRVVIGRGPWIFGADFDNQGRIAPRRLADDYLTRLKLTLTERRDWLAERGATLILLFMPTKTSVYGASHLPSPWRFDAEQPTESEQLYHFLGPDFAENVVPVRARIQQLSEEIPVYYHTDGHANHQGTFAAFQQMIEHLETHFPEKAPPPYPAFNRKLDYLQPTGYGRLMGIPFKDASWVSVPVGGFQFAEQASPPYRDRVPAGAKPRFLTNPHVDDIQAVLIGDSFTNRMAAYFGQIFRKATRIHTNNIANKPEEKFPTAYLDRARPDYVVFSYVESRLAACAEACDGFPLNNPKDVRQARLRRLFQNASPDRGETGFVLAKITNQGAQTIRLRAPAHDLITDPALTFEVRSIDAEPGETLYLFLGKAAKGRPLKPLIQGASTKVFVTTRTVAENQL